MRILRILTGTLVLTASLVPTHAFAQAVVPFRTVAQPGNMAGTWVVESPNGRFLLLRSSVNDSLLMYEKSTKRSWTLGARGASPVFSPTGDRIAFELEEEGKGVNIWTLPMNSGTGRPSAPAQRVTVKPGTRLPALSPDGRVIAFQRDANIYTIPTTGGEERLIVDEAFPTGRAYFSPDGRWIYYRAAKVPTAPLIFRVPAGGGTAEQVLPGNALLGVSPSGKYLAYYPTFLPYQASDATIAFATLDGKELVRARMPVGAYWGAWANGDRFVFASLDVPVGLNRIRLSDGALAELTPKRSFDGGPQYSPDGRWIAARRKIDNEWRLVLLSADGKLQRNLSRDPMLDRGHAWSPDGKYVAFLTIPRELAVVEVATGRQSVLTSATGPGGGRFQWRDDSKALRHVHSQNPQMPEIREVSLEGKSRVLLRLDSANVVQTAINFLDDDNIVLIRPGSIAIKPLAGGPDREVFSGRHSVGETVGISPDRKWLSVAMPHASGGTTVGIVPLSTGGSPRMLPFVQPCGIQARLWHPDGRHLLVSSPTNCKDRFDIYLVPLDGGAARNLTAVDAKAVDTNTITVSPDGKYIVYDSEEAWNTQIDEIDVPALLGNRQAKR